MRAAPAPRLHLFVCANTRDGSPLGPGCGAAGDAVYEALKREVTARGAIASVWITKTHCLGVCPKHGATVARYPSGDPIRADVTPEDAAALFEESPGPLDLALRELDALAELEQKKVIDLARRLRPDLTPEDIKNPHDFPELHDPDWHYADGVLTGVESAASTLRALKNRGS